MREINHMDIKKSTIKGTAWSMVERFSTMGIQLLCTLFIAQYLAPSEFGLVSMMSIFLSFSMVMAEAGFGQAIIREKNVTKTDTSSIFIFNIIIGLVIYALCFLCAPLIASFYRQPELTILVRVSFLSIIIQSFAIVQGALLQKSVDFAKVSKVSLVSVLLSGIIGIVVAVIYKNVWALVLQSLSFAIFQTMLYWILCKWYPTWEYSWQSVKKYLAFSLNLLGSRLIAALADNMANLFIGRAYTSTELGNYTVPDKLQRSVAGTISFSIHRVSYSVMASFQDNIDELRVYSQKIVGMAFYITAPIMVYLMIVAPQFFSIILSPEWAESAIYFRYMCVIGAIFCFADINMDVLLVRGKSALVLKIEIIRKILLIVSLLIGIMYSIKILLLILVTYNVFNALFVSYYSGKEICCSLFEQFQNVFPIVFCNLIAGLSTFLFRLLLVNQTNNYVILLLTSILYIIVYLVGNYLMKLPYPTLIVEQFKTILVKRTIIERV